VRWLGTDAAYVTSDYALKASATLIRKASRHWFWFAKGPLGRFDTPIRQAGRGDRRPTPRNFERFVGRDEDTMQENHYRDLLSWRSFGDDGTIP
jgi:hypothetical protein